MNELGVIQQRTIDRVALAGSLVAAIAAAAFILLDPVQTVARRAAPVAAAAPAAAAPAPVIVDTTPVRSVALSAPTWYVVSDGKWAAYVTSGAKGSPGEIAVRSLSNDDWHIAYRATPGWYVGQLSLVDGLLAFEELLPAGSGSVAPRVAVKTLRIDSGENATLDEYLALDYQRYGEGGGYASSSPITDGSRVFWVHQTAMAKGGVCNEIRMRDLASGKTTLLYQKMATLGSLAVWGDMLAFTRFSEPTSTAFVFDIPSRTLTAVDGFDYSVVQSVGPSGAVVTGGSTSGGAASWLVKADGTRSRLASDCYNILANSRVSAMRCATQIEIHDLATGASVVAFAGGAGALAIFPNGVLWAEGDSLAVYEARPLVNVVSDARPN